MSKKIDQPEIPFAASARSLDLEYPNIGNIPTLGIAVTCPCCSGDFAVPFNSTLGAWRSLVSAVSDLTGVGRRELLSQGRRPTEEALLARRLLVHGLRKIADEPATIRWLTILGFQSRWVRKELDAALPAHVDDWLAELPEKFTADESSDVDAADFSSESETQPAIPLPLPSHEED